MKYPKHLVKGFTQEDLALLTLYHFEFYHPLNTRLGGICKEEEDYERCCDLITPVDIDRRAFEGLGPRYTYEVVEWDGNEIFKSGAKTFDDLETLLETVFPFIDDEGNEQGGKVNAEGLDWEEYALKLSLQEIDKGRMAQEKSSYIDQEG